MNASNLVGAKEIAERAGVKRDTIWKWRRRYPTFPLPVVDLNMGPVWDWAQIEAWLRHRSSSIPT